MDRAWRGGATAVRFVAARCGVVRCGAVWWAPRALLAEESEHSGPGCRVCAVAVWCGVVRCGQVGCIYFARGAGREVAVAWARQGVSAPSRAEEIYYFGGGLFDLNA